MDRQSTLDLRDWAREDPVSRAVFLKAYGDENNKALEACQVVGLAMDGSRASRRNWKILTVTFPELDAASWLLPQTRRETNQLLKVVPAIQMRRIPNSKAP